ncbi:MAG TPA: hypothetical protein VH089_02520 [Streptosporangiaceae bacterium]|nr:hypothetical protein [Streptosporangiaceae bacterium]
MTLSSPHAAQAREVADAILYEGYLLYPYRQSSSKNQARFQFGVLMPPAYAAVDDCEPSASQTECLAEAGDDARVQILVRFLHVQRRTVWPPPPAHGSTWADVPSLTVDGTEYTRFTEATEREAEAELTVADLGGDGVEIPFHIVPGLSIDDLTDSGGRRAGQLRREWDGLDGVLRIQAERVAGPYQALRLRLRIENHTAPGPALDNREDGLRYALVAAHALIGLPGGSFISMTDHPEWATGAVAACHNQGTWPVLAGPEDCRDLMLSSPVILYDHPQIAPESAGDLFDATEIDEILTLRTMALTDEEKREARATDPRAADLIDRLDGLPPEMLEKMHGAIRYLEPGAGPVSRSDREPGPPPAAGPFPAAPAIDDQVPVFHTPDVPWWDPGADTSVSPDTDQVLIAGVAVARGSKVRMRPGVRRADAQDLFLIGREAQVEAILQDVDGQVHVAVTPVEDPMADLQRAQGRFLYFAPDELEPLGEEPS